MYHLARELWWPLLYIGVVILLFFQDFENEDPISEVVPPAASEFTMYPPVENTPETMSAAPVYFEPLPDFSHRLEDKNQHLLNQTQLRPKISEVLVQ